MFENIDNFLITLDKLNINGLVYLFKKKKLIRKECEKNRILEKKIILFNFKKLINKVLEEVKSQGFVFHQNEEKITNVLVSCFGW
jgi:hypothetical protein